MPTATINNITLDYETWGSPADPTVLLVMGLGSQRIVWPPELITGLADHALHVVTFDNRDAGRSSYLSDHPAGGALIMRALSGEAVTPPYTLADMAADAVGLLDHIGADRAHVVGASMGGMIAQHLAFGHPARVTSLTSIMSTTGDQAVGGATPAATTELFAQPPAERAAWIEDFVRRRRLLGSPTMFSEERARRLAEAVFERGINPAGTARQLLAIYADGDRTARLGTITVPTLVIHGDADPLIDVSGGRATAAAVPDAQLLVLPGMGHDLPLALLPQLTDVIVWHIAAAQRATARVG